MTNRTGRPPGAVALRTALAAAAAGAAVATLGPAVAGAAVRASAPNATARIQSLLDHPVGGTVSLPPGSFTITPPLRLRQGERIAGHGTTLRVASGTGGYTAVLAGATPQTDLSGLRVSGVTIDQNPAGNPVRSAAPLYHGQPRFAILASAGTGITISGDRFLGADGVDAVVTGAATREVSITGNVIRASDPLGYDESSIYTSGQHTTIAGNTLSCATVYACAAIEVHGSGAAVTGNEVRGYPRAANIAASHTVFRGNRVTGALNPVDLWSVAAPGLADVQVTGNTLGQNLAWWKHAYAAHGHPFPAARYTRMVVRDPSSRLPFHAIVVHGNRG